MSSELYKCFICGKLFREDEGLWCWHYPNGKEGNVIRFVCFKCCFEKCNVRNCERKREFIKE